MFGCDYMNVIFLDFDGVLDTVHYNTDDDVSLNRIINVPKRGIGTKTLSNLTLKAATQNISMFEAIDSVLVIVCPLGYSLVIV